MSPKKQVNHNIRKHFNSIIYNISRYTEIALSIVILVVIALATIMGRIPKISLEGFHVVPRRNFSGPIFPIAGIPFAKRNAQIRNTASTEVQAAAMKIIFIPFSLKWFINNTFLL